MINLVLGLKADIFFLKLIYCQRVCFAFGKYLVSYSQSTSLVDSRTKIPLSDGLLQRGKSFIKVVSFFTDLYDKHWISIYECFGLF